MGSATVTAGLQLRGRGLGQGLPSQAGLLDGDQHCVHYLRRPYQRDGRTLVSQASTTTLPRYSPGLRICLEPANQGRLSLTEG